MSWSYEDRTNTTGSGTCKGQTMAAEEGNMVGQEETLSVRCAAANLAAAAQASIVSSWHSLAARVRAVVLEALRVG